MQEAIFKFLKDLSENLEKDKAFRNGISSCYII
jgi:hypothetical protein